MPNGIPSEIAKKTPANYARSTLEKKFQWITSEVSTWQKMFHGFLHKYRQGRLKKILHALLQKIFWGFLDIFFFSVSNISQVSSSDFSFNSLRNSSRDFSRKFVIFFFSEKNFEYHQKVFHGFLQKLFQRFFLEIFQVLLF